MRIVILKNTTEYREDDLRRIIRAACKHTGAKVQLLRVELRTSTTESISGRATCKPGERARWLRAYMELYIPRPDKLRPAEFKRVVIHEAMHLAGATHTSMTEEQRYCTFDLPAWAEAFPLRVREKAETNVVLAASRIAKLEHQRKMHAKALTRLRRAQTIEKRWRRVLLRTVALCRENP